MTNVDNITVSPGGELFVADDGANLELVRLGFDGVATPFLRLADPSDQESELTGPAFSPDGSRLYVSSQRGTNGGGLPIGVTFEITGPFAGAGVATNDDGNPTAPPAPTPTTPSATATSPTAVPTQAATATATAVPTASSNASAAAAAGSDVAAGGSASTDGTSPPRWWPALPAGAGVAAGLLAYRSRLGTDRTAEGSES